jgi:hypothetical protein
MLVAGHVHDGLKVEKKLWGVFFHSLRL